MPVEQGMGIDLFDTKGKMYTLVSGEDVARSSTDKQNARYSNLRTARKLVTSSHFKWVSINFNNNRFDYVITTLSQFLQ